MWEIHQHVILPSGWPQERCNLWTATSVQALIMKRNHSPVSDAHVTAASGAAQPAVVAPAGRSMSMPQCVKEETDEPARPSTGHGAAQPAAVYPTVALSNMSTRIRQYSVCYRCALTGHEIRKNTQCGSCGKRKRSVLMVASPETWPSTREATKCYRCQCFNASGVTGIYTITRSALEHGNTPICCNCYGVELPNRHAQRNEESP